MAEGKVLGIGGLFLRSEDAERLAQWYREHLGFTVTAAGEQDPDGNWMWRQDGGPTVFRCSGPISTISPRIGRS